MKKENVLKSIILFAGTGLTYLKYNFLLFFNFEYLLFVIIAFILLLITVVVVLNKKVYGLKTVIINPKLVLLFSKFKYTKSPKKNKTEEVFVNSSKTSKSKKRGTLELFLWGTGAIGFGGVLGFYFKTFSWKTINNAMDKGSKWESELYLEKIKSIYDFFELGNKKYVVFDFNWQACFMGIISIVLIYFILKKTIFLKVLKTKLKPYLK